MTLTIEKKETTRLPEWFRRSYGKKDAAQKLTQQLASDIPNSICAEAKCPNRSECWSKGILTFMILGTVCTRTCRFCSVRHGKPQPPDKGEIDQTLDAIEKLNLKFVVLTSPNRDDLADGGSGHYAEMVQAIKSKFPAVKVEVLIPDFKGKLDDLKTVIQAKPDVINHNVETVPSLYRIARKGSLFHRSINLLKTIKDIDSTILTKSGLMVGLGEEEPELLETCQTIANAGVDILTLGQYLKPDRHSLPVKRYYSPDKFKDLQDQTLTMGFRYVFSGPLVRSSYLAEHVFDDVVVPS